MFVHYKAVYFYLPDKWQIKLVGAEYFEGIFILI